MGPVLDGLFTNYGPMMTFSRPAQRLRGGEMLPVCCPKVALDVPQRSPGALSLGLGQDPGPTLEWHARQQQHQSFEVQRDSRQESLNSIAH